MKLHIVSPLKVLVFSIVLIFQFSCSKDTDLLTDYVLADVEQTLDVRKYVVDDTYVFSSSGSIVLDVLSNDAFVEQEEVTITETSTPSNGTVEINANETLTYTPVTDTPTTDTFTYTTEVVNEDQTVTTEEGTVTVTLTDDTGKSGTIELNSLKAFPSAFGAGKDLTGGRITPTYYAVTNLNNSGEGSFRDALLQGDNVIIIPKVEGIVNLTSALEFAPQNDAPDNVTIWGQFAPGNGLTISGNRITFEGANNWVVRHITFQNKGGDVERSAVGWREMTEAGGLGHYIDHVSARWGMDQTLDIGQGVPTAHSTVAYSFIGQGESSHNTGGIIGDGGSGTLSTGRITQARNAFVSVSHRTFNIGGTIDAEVYNNYVVNYNSRLSAVRGAVKIDFFNNYVERGNYADACNSCVNKMEDPYVDMRTYTADNYVEHIDETPSGNQTTLWKRRNNTEGADDTAISANHYVSTRQHDFGAPPDGIWDWSEVKTKTLANAGHNRGINADGSPGFFRDDVDDDYATRAKNGTTRSTRQTVGEWTNSTMTGVSLYTDTDGDFMPDWFENQHPHLNPNEDDKDSKNIDWNFGNYNVVNNAGYTNLEICAEYYAGGFETMLD